MGSAQLMGYVQISLQIKSLQRSGRFSLPLDLQIGAGPEGWVSIVS